MNAEVQAEKASPYKIICKVYIGYGERCGDKRKLREEGSLMRWEIPQLCETCRAKLLAAMQKCKLG